MPRVSRIGMIFAATSALCFGFSGPLAKALIGAGISPLQVAWIRLAGAAVLLITVMAAANPRALIVRRARLVFVAVYSLVGCAAVQAFYYGTVARLTVGIAVLLEYLSPVLVVAWVRLVRRVRLPGSAMAGAVLAVSGLACVVQVWNGVRVDAPGLLLGLATAACAAVYFLLSQDVGEGVHPLACLAWGLAGAAVILVPLARPWHLPWHVLAGDLSLGGRTLAAPLALFWLILVATVAAYATSIAALRRLTAAIGATVASLEVIASVVIAWALLGETLRPVQLLGGGFVLGGALLAQHAVARQKMVAPPSRKLAAPRHDTTADTTDDTMTDATADATADGTADAGKAPTRAI
jgi:drug/metabolite transporter (DMT)-like permease